MELLKPLSFILLFSLSFLTFCESANERDIEYTIFNASNYQYVSDASFVNTKMQSYLDMAYNFVIALVPDPIPSDLDITSEDTTDWIKLIQQYIEIIVFVSIFAIVAVLIPIIGIFFCSCRCCCGNCKADFEDAKENNIMKWVLVALLIVFSGLLLYGIAGLYTSNELTEDGIDNIIVSINNSVTDTQTYFDSTLDHMRILTTNNSKELVTAIETIIADCERVINEEFQTITNALSLSKTNEMTATMNVEFIKLKTTSKGIEISIKNIETELNVVKQELEYFVKNQCFKPECATLEIRMKSFPTKIPGKLPTIGELIIDDTLNTLTESTALLVALTQQIESTIGTSLDEVIAQLNTVVDDIDAVYEDIEESVKTITNSIVDKADGYIDTADFYIDEYRNYRYYIALVVCIILTAVIACILVGVCAGSLIKNDNCCGGGIGSNFLMIAVYTIFTCTIILVLVMIIHMIGLFATVIVCDPLEDPKNSETLKFLDQFVDFSEIGIDTNLSSIITDCYGDESIYKVFHLESKGYLVIIEEALEESGIEQLLEKIEQEIENLPSIGFDLDETAIENLIGELEDSGNAFFGETDKLNAALAGGDFTINLSVYIDLLEVIGGADGIIKTLVKITNDVDDVNEKVSLLLDNMRATEEIFKFEYDSFDEAIQALSAELAMVFDQLNAEEDIKSKMKEIVDNYGNEAYDLIENYVNIIVIKNIEEEVGKCKPLADALDGTVVATCDRIVDPINGFWFGIFWCVTAFVPCLIMCILLANEFAKRTKKDDLISEFTNNYGRGDLFSMPQNIKPHSKSNNNFIENRYGYADSLVGYEDVAEKYRIGRSDDVLKGYEDVAEKYRVGGPQSVFRNVQSNYASSASYTPEYEQFGSEGSSNLNSAYPRYEKKNYGMTRF